MSPSLTFDWNTSGLGLLGKRGERALAAAIRKAGNEALRAMRAQGTREVRDRKRFKASAVRKAMPIVFTRSKDIGSMEWRMNVSGKPVPLIDLPHRQGKRGVTVSVNTAGPKLVAGAFIAQMRSGHEGVFKRVGKSRLPIKELFTTRVSDVFRDEDVVPAVFARTQDVFRRSFARLLPMELGEI